MSKNIDPIIGRKINEIFNTISSAEGYFTVIRHIDDVLGENTQKANSGFESLRLLALKNIEKDHSLYRHIMQFNIVINGAIGQRDQESRDFLLKTKQRLSQKLH